ncbi:hypothetical protein EYB53_019635, partial [Candidatus Chloroploca sp. M-50]
MTSAAPLMGTHTDRGALPAAGDAATDRGDRPDRHALLGSTPTGRPRCASNVTPSAARGLPCATAKIP